MHELQRNERMHRGLGKQMTKRKQNKLHTPMKTIQVRNEIDLLVERVIEGHLRSEG